MSTSRIIYGVFEGDKLVFEGSSRTIGEKYGITYASVRFYISTQSVLHKRYTIRPLRKEKYKYVYSGADNPETDEETLSRLLVHLKEYGNTVNNSDPAKYIPYLEEKLGEKVCFSKRTQTIQPMNMEATELIMKPRKKSKKDTYYVLEVM